MTQEQHKAYSEARVPGACPVTGCTADPETGNGWYCAAHFAEVLAMEAERWAARHAEESARRSQAAKDGAETRRRNDGSAVRYGIRSTRSSASIAAGQAKYRKIKARISERW
jgi:hypothetical protein